MRCFDNNLSSCLVFFSKPRPVQFNNNHTKIQIVSFVAVIIHLQNKGNLTLD